MPKREYIVTVKEGKPRDPYGELPAPRCVLVVVSAVSLIVAVLFRLFGVTWERWPALMWITIVSAIVLLLAFLPEIVGWGRKRSKHR